MAAVVAAVVVDILVCATRFIQTDSAKFVHMV
jgi:hypothetical protein